MLSITLPFVDAWNVWWSDYGNTPAGFTEIKATVERAATEAGRTSPVEATCAVFVQLTGGGGRQMGGYGKSKVEPVRGSTKEVAEQIAAFAAVGATHVQLVVDPITNDSIEWFSDVLAVLGAS